MVKASGNIVRIRSWAEFKSLVNSLKPNSIVYNIEQNGFSPTRELTNLRLIIPGKDAYYIFLDFPEGDKLKGTGIILHKDKKGNHYIAEKDVKHFLKNQFKREDLTICSYWTI